MKAKLVEIDEKEFEYQLNENYGDVDVCGMTYSAGTVLREVDPTAFRCAMADEPDQWECSECGAVYDDEDEANECCAPELPDEA